MGWLLDGGPIIADGGPIIAAGGPIIAAGGPIIAAGGPIIAAGAVDVCLRGLVLRKALGPAEGGPEAPGGPFRGGGCMVASVTDAQTKPVMLLRILDSGVAREETEAQ